MRIKMLSLILIIFFSFPYATFAQEQQNNLSVTATVPAQAGDFVTVTELSDPTNANFPQDTTLTYQITYGTTLSNSVNFTLVANWGLGTISGSGSPTVEIVDYVVGSATSGYGSVSPVIDTVNRRITWTFTSFPANTTNQTVTFKLKTNNNYTGTLPVGFDISSLIQGPGVDSATSTIANTYQFAGSPTPTPTPTSSSGQSSQTVNTTPTLAPTATPTPSKTTIFTFNTIEINEKTATNATIGVTTSQNSTATLLYGKSPSSLTSSINSNNFGTINLIKLVNLEPKTRYYFRIRANNNVGRTITSDIFTFTTATESELPTINLKTLTVTSQNKVVLDGALAKNLNSNTVLATKNLAISIQFAVNKDAKLKRIVLNVSPKNILGVNTFSNIQAPETKSTLIEIQKGIYYGNLNPGLVGTFVILARIEDESGNIVEQKVADMKVLESTRIISRSTKLPVEGARVSLSFFNLRNNKFETISPTSFGITNPTFSDHDGMVTIVLPPGKYKADVGAFGYQTKTVEFVIGLGANEKYPLIELLDGPFTFGGTVKFTFDIISDMYNSASEIFTSFSLSTRITFLLESLTIILLFVLLLLSISLHFSVSPYLLPRYLFYHASTLFFKKRPKELILKGVIVNREDGYGIKGIFVYIHASKNKILTHTVTNSFGEFYVKVAKSNSYLISTMHQSFNPPPIYEVPFKDIDKNQKIYVSEKHHTIIARFFHQAGWYGGYVLSDITELLLLITFALEIFFMLNLNFMATLPFVIIASINLVLLVYYRKHKEESKIG